MASLAPTFGRGAMTNLWQDIKNADVVIIMGGNAAEAHPCGFKWVTEAKATTTRQADRGRSALHAHRPRSPISTAPIRPGTDIAFLRGVIELPAGQRQDPAGVRQGLHQRRLHRRGGLRLQGRPVHRLRRGQARLRPLELGLRDRRTTAMRQGRRRRCSTRAASCSC